MSQDHGSITARLPLSIPAKREESRRVWRRKKAFFKQPPPRLLIVVGKLALG